MKKINGAKIRHLREEKGWTQELLGEYVNIDQRTISDIELNRNKSDIGEKDINAFAEVFQVSPEYFFDDESNIVTNHKPSGSRTVTSKKIKISDIIKISNEYMEVFDGKYIEAHEFIKLYGDFEVKNIKVELKCTKTSIYRNNELIDKDSETSTVVVLEV